MARFTRELRARPHGDGVDAARATAAAAAVVAHTVCPSSPRWLGAPFAHRSATQWCPPCKQFTPVLSAWNTRNAAGKKLQLVFVSSDRSAPQFAAYLKEMSWGLGA